MPIYEYRRPDGSTFEVQQSFKDDPLAVDPETGVPVERVLHPPAVHFKGKGFYNTDYGTRKRQRETAAAAEGSSASETSSKGEGDASKGEGAPSKGEGAASKGEGAKTDSAGKSDAGKSDKGAKRADSAGNSSGARPAKASRLLAAES